jgi:hypothetical protein
MNKNGFEQTKPYHGLAIIEVHRSGRISGDRVDKSKNSWEERTLKYLQAGEYSF